MKTFTCSCGNRVFFENTRCITCGLGLGWCPACSAITALEPLGDGLFRCGGENCGVTLTKCHNYAVEHVCNRCCVAVEGEVPARAPLCDYCRFNETIPDLSVSGNREMWHRLEEAKRRLLYTLDLLSLPYGSAADGFEPPLAFDFKADPRKKSDMWWSSGPHEQVHTGHADGKITINLREADTVEREKTRVLFEEAHRTVIGHFRHEIGHYFWQMLVHDRCEDEFRAVFGNHNKPTYADALKHYYKHGAPANWQSSHVSAYATMHPWEDFAESFGTFIDMVSILDTARNMGMAGTCDPARAKMPTMVRHYIRIGVVLNELNRAMGLIDIVPEILVPPVVKKLEFVYNLVKSARKAYAVAQ